MNEQQKLSDKEMIDFQDARIFALLRDIERANEREHDLIERVEELERGRKAHMDWLRETVTTNASEEAIAAIKRVLGDTELLNVVRERLKDGNLDALGTRAFDLLADMPDDSDSR